jgi:hypothetical protein
MKADDLMLAEPEILLFTSQTCIDGKGLETNAVPRCAGQSCVSVLNGRAIKLMHNNACTETFAEFVSASHVIDMAMHEDRHGELVGIEAQRFDISYDSIDACSGPVPTSTNSPRFTRYIEQSFRSVVSEPPPR